MKLRGEVINDALEMAGYISMIIMLIWGICVKLKMREQDRRDHLERMRQDRIRQEARLKRKQEREKLTKPSRVLPPPPQKQLPSGRVKVALIVEENDGK